MSKPDTLAIVQFIHPGKEQTKVTKGQCDWNAATRSDKSWPHRRKFMVNQADYIHQGERQSGSVGFWGEWEGPSFAKKIGGSLKNRGRTKFEPSFIHRPAIWIPKSYEGLLDTDPFVFGDRFLYNGCQQHTAHNHPDGARDTFLRRLSVGTPFMSVKVMIMNTTNALGTRLVRMRI